MLAAMKKPLSFRDRTIVITGASDGIGAEMARQFAPEGPKLVLAARSADALGRVAAACEAAGAQALAVRTDVSDEAQCRALIRAAIDRFGGLDVLVNNAGISMHSRFENVTDLSTYERLFRVNVMGTIWCTHEALPHLKARRGQVVGVSSLAGLTGVPGRTTYCASKFAMTGFLEALRLELTDDGVDVTTIFPGVVTTDIRVHGLDGTGHVAGRSNLKEEGAMSVEECARQCIEAIRDRRPRLVMTARARVGMILKAFAPSLVDRMARGAVKPGAR
jgi:short-subunit dehydrogenase